MLASDIDNPEFLGSKNPDDMLHVEFYDYAAPDPWATRETGIQSFRKECPFVRIQVPGQKDTIIERPADGKDLKRFPRQWLHYQMMTGKIANAENVPGWQIEEWEELNPEQVRQLKFLRFYTVEQIAGANDAQIQGIGMGGAGLRTKAQDALRARQGQAVSQAVAERDAKIAGLEDSIEQMKQMMAQLLAVQAEEPKKRGRPAKVEE
jgi:hypothetical protein